MDNAALARMSLQRQGMNTPVLTIDERHNIEAGAWFSKLSLPLRSSTADWWARAQAAESAGQLDEAEAIVSRVVPPATCAVQTARLYVLRARRLAAAGDREGARQARDLAQGWTALYTGLGGATRRVETSETQGAAR